MSNADGQEFVSVGEAAERLGMDESALRRVLKRPRNAERIAGHKAERTQDTKTGLRTATVYPLAVIAEVARRPLPQAAPPGLLPDATDQNAEQSPDKNAGSIPDESPDKTPAEEGTNTGPIPDTSAGGVFTLDERMRAYVALLTQEMRGRIEDRGRVIEEQAARIEELMRDRDRLQGLLDAKADPKIAPPMLVSAPESAGKVPEHEEAGAGAETTQDEPAARQKPGRWWWPFGRGESG